VRSMTGFGEKNFKGAGLHAKISIKTLNHRFFDWSYKGAPLGELENRLRSAAQQKLRRGRVEASAEVVFLDPAGWEVFVNEGLLEKVLSSLEKVSRRLGKSPLFSLENLFRIPQLVEIRRKSLSLEQTAFLEKSFERVLEEILRQRRREGRQTAAQVRSHLRSVRRSLNRIERLARKQPSLFHERVRERLKELNNRILATPARLEEEVAFLAQRADIAEELLRLRAHVDSCERIIRGKPEEPAGKRLDFLAQEIYREANTINSKSQDIDIIKESLTIKGEVESVRQHVQNLE